MRHLKCVQSPTLCYLDWKRGSIGSIRLKYCAATREIHPRCRLGPVNQTEALGSSRDEAPATRAELRLDRGSLSGQDQLARLGKLESKTR